MKRGNSFIVRKLTPGLAGKELADGLLIDCVVVISGGGYDEFDAVLHEIPAWIDCGCRHWIVIGQNAEELHDRIDDIIFDTPTTETHLTSFQAEASWAEIVSEICGVWWELNAERQVNLGLFCAPDDDGGAMGLLAQLGEDGVPYRLMTGNEMNSACS